MAEENLDDALQRLVEEAQELKRLEAQDESDSIAKNSHSSDSSKPNGKTSSEGALEWWEAQQRKAEEEKAREERKRDKEIQALFKKTEIFSQGQQALCGSASGARDKDYITFQPPKDKYLSLDLIKTLHEIDRQNIIRESSERSLRLMKELRERERSSNASDTRKQAPEKPEDSPHVLNLMKSDPLTLTPVWETQVDPTGGICRGYLAGKLFVLGGNRITQVNPSDGKVELSQDSKNNRFFQDNASLVRIIYDSLSGKTRVQKIPDLAGAPLWEFTQDGILLPYKSRDGVFQPGLYVQRLDRGKYLLQVMNQGTGDIVSSEEFQAPLPIWAVYTTDRIIQYTRNKTYDDISVVDPSTWESEGKEWLHHEDLFHTGDCLITLKPLIAGILYQVGPITRIYDNVTEHSFFRKDIGHVREVVESPQNRFVVLSDYCAWFFKKVDHLVYRTIERIVQATLGEPDVLYSHVQTESGGNMDPQWKVYLANNKNYIQTATVPVPQGSTSRLIVDRNSPGSFYLLNSDGKVEKYVVPMDRFTKQLS